MPYYERLDWDALKVATGGEAHAQASSCLWDRRTVLKAAVAAMAGSVAAPAWATHILTKFRKNVRLGITTQVYAKLPLEEAARRIKADGFRCVLLSFRFADVQFDPLKPDWAAAKKITDALAKQDIAITTMYGYYNLVDPDEKRRQEGEARMECMMRNWKRLGCNVISTETGTYNAKSQWLDDPKNATEEAYLKCREVLKRWAKLGEQTGAVLTLEASYKNIIGTVDRAERVLKEVDSPALKLVMDPANYFGPDNLKQMKPLLKELFARLGPKAALVHAKDIAPSAEKGTETPASGLGEMDYPLFLQLVAQLDRPIDMLMEHVKLEDVARARDYVLANVEKLP